MQNTHNKSNRRLWLKYVYVLVALLLMIPALPAFSQGTGNPARLERPPSQLYPDSGDAANHSGRGPSGPPESSDTIFTVDTGATLDDYRFRSESPILFNIEIDRVVGRVDTEGYLIDADKLIQNGLLSDKAHLQLLVYDVDEDYAGSDVVREIDRVYLNGHFIGTLSGANDTWSVTRFDFDIRYLKFARSSCVEYGGATKQDYLSACHSAPTVAQNEIRIDIDTGNSGSDVWAVETDWGAISLDAARPVLFVHGKGGSDGSGACMANSTGGCTYWDADDGRYFFNFRGQFNQAGYLTNITENRLGGETTIAYNAKILKTIIAEVKTRYGVDKINIVSHSKGGLDARGYISDSSLNSANDVEKLVTLASPHHGSYLADLGINYPPLAWLLGQSITEATKNVSEDYMKNTFNPSHPGKADVSYYSIPDDAGSNTGPFGLYELPDWQVNSLYEEDQRKGAPWAWNALYWLGNYKGHNDFLVTVPSANLNDISGHGANTITFDDYNRNHHSIRAAERQEYEKDLTIVNLVKSCLDLKTGYTGTYQSQTGNATQATTSDESSTLSSLNGAINQGATVEQVVGVDSSTHVDFALFWQEGELYLELVSPLGQVITSTTSDPNIKYSESRTGEYFNYLMKGKLATFSIANPAQGQWTVRVKAAQSLPGGQVQWAVLSSQESQVSLDLSTTETWQKFNNQVTLQATLKDGATAVTGAVANAEIVAPSGAKTEITLVDNGSNGDAQANDGVYTGKFTASEAGVYRLAADTNSSKWGIPVQRTAVGQIPVGSDAASLSIGYTDTGIDNDGDGYYNYLRINVPVSVKTAGTYRVVGTLYDAASNKMVDADASLVLGAGANTIALNFDGKQIAENNGSGTFTLRDLQLIDKTNDEPLQVDFNANAYTTKAYTNGQFEHSPLYLTGSSSNWGTDLNGNGKYDTLTVQVGAYVETAGTYTWNARLTDASDFEYGWSSSTSYLSAGINQINFVFDGKTINGHRVNGPYYLKDLAMWGISGYIDQIYVASTSAYLYTQFEPAPTRVFLPIIDRRAGFESDFNGTSGSWTPVVGSWWVDASYYNGYSASNAFSTAYYAAAQFANLDYRARLRRTGCSSCSNVIIIRGVVQPLSGISFWGTGISLQYTNNGWYSVWAQNAGGGEFPLAEWATTGAVIQGENWNELRVVANGSGLTFYINGNLVWSGSTSIVNPGYVGLGFYSNYSGDMLYVDWAKLSELNVTAPQPVVNLPQTDVVPGRIERSP